ncbi:exopolyphosphatase [Dietzia maris]|uniref:Exopolyphosphatase n=1 Tax=Dietzia maris TaxID=37915 RepID=A0A365P8V8_9ACTN|nr:acyclic terpene utilization AtuA family protein [Dietzia sp. KRD202]RBA33784.1 exopolyphosphatase [Dietzia maris]
MTARAIRIGNASGFYGDRAAAFREMVEGGPVDVITGDYLAELTMLILWKARKKDPSAGYAKTFLTQLRENLTECVNRGIKVVVNAGGLNPSGLANAVRELATELELDVSVAHIEGDDLMPRFDDLLAEGHDFRHLDKEIPFTDAGVTPVSANAYLGAWGIVEALGAGADIVICPRVTDASLVVGASAWWHGWDRTDFDELAGAVLAGHIIECGPQATGGNYSQLAEVTDRRYPGFPIVEMASDGSFVVTKHDDTGGLVSVGTVTAQVLYEIDDPRYLNPDVVSHFDTASITQEGPSRVRVTGVRGTPPPPTLKVAMNYVGGYRNTMTLVLTGLDIEEKARWAEDQLFEILGGKDRFDEVDVQLLRYDRPDPTGPADSTAHLRVTVKDRDRAKVDRAFSNAVMELFLAGYAGFHTTTPPSSASEYGVYWPAIVPKELVEHAVVHGDGRRQLIPHPPEVANPPREPLTQETVKDDDEAFPSSGGQMVTLPLGRIASARSGDKGGNANVGLWVQSDAEWSWLRDSITVERFRQLLPEAAHLPIRRYELPSIRSLNFVVVGLLGDGVASTTRLDAQAKGLGEFIRARMVDVPAELAPDA